MKFLHLADLHIGKSLCGYSLLEDQEEVFSFIVEETARQAPDMILIAGDVFDRSVPSEGAIALYERFVSALSATAPVYMISGNHDSGVRLELFRNILENQGIHIAGTLAFPLEKHVLKTDKEEAHIYLLPYLSPNTVRNHFKTDIHSFEEAVLHALETLELDENAINILVSHQFYTNTAEDITDLPEGSERTVVGGLDNVAARLLDRFDYAALGHIHRPVRVRGERIRYAGSPLKYSANESEKALHFIELTKTSITTDKVPIHARRDVREIEGRFDELATPDKATEDYVSIKLVGEPGVVNVKERLLAFYPNLLRISYDTTEQIKAQEISRQALEERPVELLERFISEKGYVLEPGQKKLAEKILRELNETD